MEGTMASDPKEPSAAATDEATTDAAHGVPIIPGVPFLPGREVPAAESTGTAGTGEPGGIDGTGLPGGLPVLPTPGGPVDASAAPVPSHAEGTAPTPVDDAGIGWQPSGASSGREALPDGESRAGSVQGRSVERTSRRDKDSGPEPASALTAERLLAGVERPPVSGWRRWLYTLTFGRVNVGDSDAVRVQRAFEHRISARLGERTRYVPVLSRKGGVGKTTVTTLLGMALADIREDRIIAMDANPDRGTLSDRSPGRADFTARQLVQNRYTIESFAQLAGYVTRDGSRLHVLASDSDPAVAQAFDDTDYRAVTDVLSRYYSIVLTDSGTGMVHSVMKGTLEKADSVVLVSGGSVDEARLASETLSWLEAHGRQDLLAKAIVVINLSSGNGTQVDVSQIEQHFRSRVGTVIRIPYDRHLAEGSRIELGKLNPATRRAVTELAALVVDQLGS